MSKRSLNLNRAVSCHTANQGLVGWWLGLPGCLDKTSLRDITPFRNPAILDPPNSGYKSSVVLDGTNTRFYSLLNTAGPYNHAGATARILNILPLSLNGPLSVSAWFRNTAATSGYTGQFLSLCNSSNNWGLGLGYNQIVTTRYGAILNTSPCGASPGTYHYLYTQDGANHNKLFINGVLYASATGAGDAANLDTIQIIKGVGNVGSSVGDYVGDVRVLNWDASNQAGFLYRQRLKAYPDLLAYRSWVSFAKPAGAAALNAAGAGTVSITGAGTLSAIDTAAGAGTVSIAGTSTSSVKDQMAGAGTVSITGASTSSAVDTAAGAGTVSIIGVGTASVVGTVSGAGIVSIAGTGTTSVLDQATGAGIVTISGTGTITTGSNSNAIAAGTVPITGASSASAIDTVAGAGTVAITGTSIAAIKDTAAGAGTVSIAGSGTMSLLAQMAGAGVVPIVGSGSITTGNNSNASANGTVPISGSTTATVIDTITVSGVVSILGSSSGSILIQAAGSGVVPISGSGFIHNGPTGSDTNVYVFYLGV